MGAQQHLVAVIRDLPHQVLFVQGGRHGASALQRQLLRIEAQHAQEDLGCLLQGVVQQLIDLVLHGDPDHGRDRHPPGKRHGEQGAGQPRADRWPGAHAGMR